MATRVTRVTRVVVIECGAAETRAALIIDDVPRQFWFGPARGDETLPRSPQTGEVFSGRVRGVSPALRGAFVDIGVEREAFLPLKKGVSPPVEGAAIIAMVRRPQIGAKGAVLTLDWRRDRKRDEASVIEAEATSRKPGPLGVRADAAVLALDRFHGAPKDIEPEIIIDDPAVKRSLNAFADAEIVASPFRRFELAAAIAESFEPVIPFANGAQLQFHETEAGVVIDVDSAAAAESAAGRINDKINEAAANRIVLEIQRRGLGGRIIVDFLPPSVPAARARLAELVKEALREADGARFGRLAPDGLCDLTLPRRGLSLLELATELAGEQWPVHGRRFTIDWSAKRAIGALQDALAARPSSTPRLIVADDIGTYLQRARPQWNDRLLARYGARFVIQPSPLMEQRSHDLVE